MKIITIAIILVMLCFIPQTVFGATAEQYSFDVITKKIEKIIRNKIDTPTGSQNLNIGGSGIIGWFSDWWSGISGGKKTLYAIPASWLDNTKNFLCSKRGAPMGTIEGTWGTTYEKAGSQIKQSNTVLSNILSQATGGFHWNDPAQGGLWSYLGQWANPGGDSVNVSSNNPVLQDAQAQAQAQASTAKSEIKKAPYEINEKGAVGPITTTYKYAKSSTGKIFGGITGVEFWTTDGKGNKLQKLDPSIIHWSESKDASYDSAKPFVTKTDSENRPYSEAGVDVPASGKPFYIYIKESELGNIENISFKFYYTETFSNVEAQEFKPYFVREDEEVYDQSGNKISPVYVGGSDPDKQWVIYIKNAEWGDETSSSEIPDMPVGSPKLHVEKFVSEISGEKITERIPVYDPATKKFTKTGEPEKSVKVGDKVTYTVRVYNIGNADFIGKNYKKDEVITDKADDGLAFLKSESDEFWGTTHAGSKSFEYKVTNIPKTIKAYSGSGQPDYYDISISFNVTEAGLFKVITNTITYKDEEEDEKIISSYVDIEGDVWQDIRKDKSTINDNLFTKGEDFTMEGILVELIDANTGKLAENNIPAEVKDDRRTVIAQAITNKDGHYEFKDLWLYYTKTTNKDGKVTSVTSDIIKNTYYIRFLYNGQEYITVAKGDITKENTSKVVEIDRNAYNTKFEEIQPGKTASGINLSYGFPANASDGSKGVLVKYYNSDTNVAYRLDKETNPVKTQYYTTLPATPDSDFWKKGNLKEEFVIQSKTDNIVFTNGFDVKTKKIQNMNMGLLDRNPFDLTLKKDLYEAKVTMKNDHEKNADGSDKLYTETYKYNSRVKENMNIDVRGNGTYELNVRSGDLGFITGVEVTYRIRIINQTDAQNYKAVVTNIVDYYHSSLELKGYRLGDMSAGMTALTGSGTVNIPVNAEVPAAGLDVYVTYNVKLADINTSLASAAGKLDVYNYAEIGGYKTYKPGSTTPEGVIDRDSAPGTFTPSKYENNSNGDFLHQAYANDSTVELLKKTMPIFEDDADRAPGLIIQRKDWSRELRGNVWDDDAQLITATGERYGDGLINDLPISNVLVELLWADDMSRVQGPIPTNAAGQYTFGHYLPGNYIVRFTYGREGELDAGGNPRQEIKYNGQDYKSTVYNEENHNPYSDANQTYWYDIEKSRRESDALDVWGNAGAVGTRQHVNSYSNILTNYNAEILKGVGAAFRDNSIALTSAEREEFINNTHMTALTSPMRMEIEYAKQTKEFFTNDQAIDEVNYNSEQNYPVHNVDFGLAERPRAAIEVIKRADNVKITLQDNRIHVNTGATATNVSWIPKAADDTIQGMIQVTLDENLIAGATIEVTYAITVKNVGEVDYEDISYYINPLTGTKNNIVRITPSILDYPSNTLRFVEGKNDAAWEKKQSADSITVGGRNYTVSSVADPASPTDPRLSLVDSDISINTFDTKILRVGKALEPDRPGADPDRVADSYILLLENTMSSENSGNDLRYENITELVMAQSFAGRRFYLGNDTITPGNLNPNEPDARALERDESIAEEIAVLPPYGADQNFIIYGAIGIAAAAILVVGIILIKRKVVK